MGEREGGGSLTPLQKRILEVLKVNKYLSSRTVAKAVNRPYSQVYYNLLALKDRGLVKDVYARQYYPGGIAYIDCRFWYLPENEKEVLECLKSDSHTLLLKKPKF